MGSLRQAAKTLASAAGHTLDRPAGGEQALNRAQNSLWQMQRRGMAGGHHDHGETYKGLTIHKPAAWQTTTANGFCAVMWFWILYRFYNDYDTFLFGHAQHFEHEDHEEKQGKGHH